MKLVRSAFVIVPHGKAITIGQFTGGRCSGWFKCMAALVVVASGLPRHRTDAHKLALLHKAILSRCTTFRKHQGRHPYLRTQCIGLFLATAH
jgi:hypothetical protein